MPGTWWRLPGPTRFLQKLVDALAKPPGLVGLMMPRPEPIGWLDAVRERLDEQASSQPILVDAAAGLRGRSPVRMLATSAGLETSGLRVISQFLDEDALADAVFIVTGAPVDDWQEWSLFLRTFRADRARVEQAGAPVILFAAAPAVPPAELRAALGGAPIRWSGVLSRLDTRLHVEALGGRVEDDLVARVAAETTVELAGWDRTLAEALTRLPIEQQLEPLDALMPHAAHYAGQTPCWGNGLVDYWDGRPHPSTLSLLAAGARTALAARMWSDQVAFVARYEAALWARMPYEKPYGERRQLYTDPYRLEFYDIRKLLDQALSYEENLLLGDCIMVRRSMAHNEPGDVGRIRRMSELWERLEPEFSAGSAGWEWPRCGQSLVMLIGPTCAGKSTYAEAHYDRSDIISSDAIRQEIFGSLDAAGDQSAVFERLRSQVRMRLAAGQRVVVDATHIRTADRLATARLAPPDIPVEYVVLDRPMPEKVATAGWRARRPRMLDEHAETFAANLRDILAGDGLANVRVISLLPAAEPEHLDRDAA